MLLASMDGFDNMHMLILICYQQTSPISLIYHAFIKDNSKIMKEMESVITMVIMFS